MLSIYKLHDTSKKSGQVNMGFVSRFFVNVLNTIKKLFDCQSNKIIVILNQRNKCFIKITLNKTRDSPSIIGSQNNHYTN